MLGGLSSTLKWIDVTASEALDPWERPSWDECDERRTPVALDENYLLSLRRVTWNGQLVEYAIVLSFRESEDDAWVEIHSIDTKHHRCVHRHRDGDHSTFETILQIDSQADVQNTWSDSYDEVYSVYLELTGQDPLR